MIRSHNVNNMNSDGSFEGDSELGSTADVNHLSFGALDKARQLQEQQILRKVKQLQQMNQLAIELKEKAMLKEEKERMRHELAEAERQRRIRESIEMKLSAEQRRKESLRRAQEEEEEIRRRASAKTQSVESRMKTLEDEKRHMQLRSRAVAEAKARERARIKEEAERRLQSRVGSYQAKEADTERQLEMQRERRAMTAELRRLEDLAKERHRREALERAHWDLEERRRQLTEKQREKDELTNEVIREREELAKARAMMQQSKESEIKSRIHDKRRADDAARELLSRRIQEKRERVDAMETYKGSMLREMQNMRARIRKEEDELKKMLAAASSVEDLEELTTTISAKLGGGTPGLTPRSARGAMTTPSRARSPLSTARGASPAPAAPTTARPATAPRAITPPPVRAPSRPKPAWGAPPAPPVGLSPRPGPAARAPASRSPAPARPMSSRSPAPTRPAANAGGPSSSSSHPTPPPAAAAAATNGSSRPQGAGLRDRRTPERTRARPGTTPRRLAEGAAASMQHMSDADLHRVRALIQEEKARDREREALLGDVREARERERLLKIFRMERESFRSLMEMLLVKQKL